MQSKLINFTKKRSFLLMLFVLAMFKTQANTVAARFSFFINIQADLLTNPDSNAKDTNNIEKLAKDTSKTKVLKDTTVSEGALKSPVYYQSDDSIVFNVEEHEAYLYKQGKIKYETTKLNAGFVKLNWENHNVYAEGRKDSSGKVIEKPDFDDNGQKFKSETVKYNFQSKKGKITDVITHEGEGYIHGRNVKKDAEDNMYIKAGAYTTCNLDTPHFYIAASKLKLIKNDKIVTGPAYLVIEDVVTPLCIPFGFFPNSKGQHSGILIPSVGESAQYGFSLENGGYYFAISDKMNLAVQGDIYSKGNYALRAHSQYYSRYQYSGNFNLGYTDIKNSEKELPDFSESNSFFIRWAHTQDPKAHPTARFNASVNAGSSKYFRNTLTSSGTDYLSSAFSSNISFTKSWIGKPYNFSANLRHNQNTLTKDISLSLPELAFNMGSISPFKPDEPRPGGEKWYDRIRISYAANAKNTIDTKDSLLFKKQSLKQFKNGMSQSIPISTNFKIAKFFTLTPNINYSEKWYLQSVNHRWDTAKKAVVMDTIRDKFAAAHEFSIGAGLNTRLYGMYQFKHGKIQAIRHVITPNLNFTFKPDYSKPGWGGAYQEVQSDVAGHTAKYSHFEGSIYGGPSSGTQALIGFGFDNNLEMKVRQVTDTGIVSKKIKLLESLVLNSEYNAAADSGKLHNLNIGARTILFDKLNVNYTGLFSPYAYNPNSPNAYGDQYNKLLYATGKKPVRWVSHGLSLSTSLNPAAFKKPPPIKKTENSKEEADLAYIKAHPEEFVDFNIPWNLTMGYNIQIAKTKGKVNLDSTTLTQALNFSGDLSITPQWKITFTSGYDLKAREFTYTSFSIYRDLHCWEMRFNWIPFGLRQSYNFQINVKSSILRDLKMTRRNPPSIR